MKKPFSTTTALWMVMVASVLLCADPFVPDPTYSADPPKGPPRDISTAAEPSPEQAAGGKQNLQVIRKACDEDVKKLCPDIRPGGGRILQCLRGQESNLTAACRQVLGSRSSNP